MGTLIYPEARRSRVEWHEAVRDRGKRRRSALHSRCGDYHRVFRRPSQTVQADLLDSTVGEALQQPPTSTAKQEEAGDMARRLS